MAGQHYLIRLPSFGDHVAPDGMHLVIHLLLIASMATGVIALGHLKQCKGAERRDFRLVP
jgi:hypothetical protein